MLTNYFYSNEGAIALYVWYYFYEHTSKSLLAITRMRCLTISSRSNS